MTVYSPRSIDHAATAVRADVYAGWKNVAACGGLSLLMDTPGMENDALDVCAFCPVEMTCARWVLSLTENEDPGGVCGGMTEPTRKNWRKDHQP